MTRIINLLCIAVLLTGCGPKPNRMTFQNPGDDNMIVGFGEGSLPAATNMAWKDAKNKLEMSGLSKKYGLSEYKSSWNHGTAMILFKLVPLEEEDTTAKSKKMQPDAL